nr:immunoglobulin heavy chain junction region [Macaca mulatta]MOY25727.1 immunoglobulin heavy chain junction region [Macaca mulatta]
CARVQDVGRILLPLEKWHFDIW